MAVISYLVRQIYRFLEKKINYNTYDVIFKRRTFHYVKKAFIIY